MRTRRENLFFLLLGRSNVEFIKEAFHPTLELLIYNSTESGETYKRSKGSLNSIPVKSNAVRALNLSSCMVSNFL